MLPTGEQLRAMPTPPTGEKNFSSLKEKYKYHMLVPLISELVHSIFTFPPLHAFTAFMGASTGAIILREHFSEHRFIQKIEESLLVLNEKIPYVTQISLAISLLVSFVFPAISILMALAVGTYNGFCVESTLYLRNLRIQPTS